MTRPAGKALLEQALLRIRTGQAGSIHLDALSGKHLRLDLYDLIHTGQGNHLRLLSRLLGGRRFSFRLEIPDALHELGPPEQTEAINRISDTLDNLFYQQRDEVSEYGRNSLALGFPLLVRRDADRPGGLLVAPVALWPLEIDKDLRHRRCWTISRPKNRNAGFNEALGSWLESQGHAGLDGLAAAFNAPNPSEAGLLDLCRSLLGLLGTDAEHFDQEVKILPGSNREGLSKITGDTAWIRWSGLLGMYRGSRESIARDLQTLLNSEAWPDWRESAPEAGAVPPGAGVVPLDPSQESALALLHREGRLLLHGPPGTGKSHTLTALIGQALHAGKTCLVVCTKKNALDVLHANLAALGLEGLCLLAGNTKRDRKRVVERVRSLPDQVPYNRPTWYNNNRNNNPLEEYTRYRDRATAYIAAVNRPVYGDETAAELAGRTPFIRGQRQGPGPLACAIPGKWGELRYEDRGETWRAVQDAAGRFPALRDFSAFKELTDKALESMDADGLSDRVIALSAEWEDLSKMHRNALDNFGHLYNDRGLKNRLRVGFLGLFPGKYRRIKKLRKEVAAAWDGFQESWRDMPLTGDFAEVSSHYDPFDVLLQKWNGIARAIRTLSGRLRQEGYAGDYEAYRHWRQFLNGAGDRKHLFIMLADMHPPDAWGEAFENAHAEAFLHQYADRHELDTTLSSLLENIRRQEKGLREHLPGIIDIMWEEKRAQAISRRTKKAIRELYAFRSGTRKGPRSSLRDIIHGDPELFTTVYPVLLVSPEWCSAMLPLTPGLFDYVLFDEASQLRLEDSLPALFRGKRQVITGDRRQLPPPGIVVAAPTAPEQGETVSESLTDNPSLLDHAHSSGMPEVHLDFHFRSRNPALIAFSNAAFYGDRLVPMPVAGETENPVGFVHTGGRYAKGGINRLEADAVVAWLFDPANLTEGQLPKTGIIALNAAQRNAIWNRLSETAAADDMKAAALDRWLDAGLTVKNLENSQGDEHDIVLISTIYGPDAKGRFRRQFGTLTQQHGYRLVNVLVTRARERIIAFTSIPAEAYRNLPEGRGRGLSGSDALFAWLAWAEAAAAGDDARQEEVLEHMRRFCPEPPFRHEHHRMPAFHRELYLALLEVAGHENVVPNYRYGGFTVDLALVKNGRLVGAISTDYLRQWNDTTYRMLLFKHQVLRERGIPALLAETMDWHTLRQSKWRPIQDFARECLGLP